MHFLTETVPGDIALMFLTYLGFCLLLMYLFIRADRQWNKREVEMTRARASDIVAERNGGDRMRDLTECSAHHDIHCACFVKGDDTPARDKDA